jgi:hypothetical protein
MPFVRSVKAVYLEPREGAKLVQRGDRHHVLDAINEYELLTAFGGYQSLYGAGEAPSAAYVARTRLVMAGRAEAEREANEKASGGGSGGGTGLTPDAPGTRRRPVSEVESGQAYRKRELPQRPPSPRGLASAE